MTSVLYFFRVTLGNPNTDAYCTPDILPDGTPSLLTIN